MSRSLTRVAGLLAITGIVAVVVFVVHGAIGTAPEDKTRDLAPGHGLQITTPPDGKPGLCESLSETSASREAVLPAGIQRRRAGYRVLTLDNEPVAHAPFCLFESGEVLLRGGTDGSGQIFSEPGSGDVADLIILPLGWAPQILTVPRTPGCHVIRLERGFAVSGRIIVNGEVPGQRISLVLSCPDVLADLEARAGPSWDKLGLPIDSRQLVRLETDTKGCFQFEGLAADWRGNLQLPIEYRIEQQILAEGGRKQNVVHLDAPVEGLTLRVEERLTLVGRVVDSREGQPVPGAIVHSELLFPRAYLGTYKRDYTNDVRTDDTGRFTLALPTHSILGGKIRVEHPRQQLSSEVEVKPTEVESQLDLGDIVLGGPCGIRTISLKIIEKGSRPIQGAVADIGPSSPPSAPTDGSGRTVLGNVVPGSTEFVVVARGYETARGLVPAEVPDELVVALRVGTLLDIRFSQPGSNVARGIHARLAATEHPFREGRASPSREACARVGQSYYEVFEQDDGSVAVRLSADEEGRVVLNDLEPGIPMQLRVEGGFFAEIQEEPIPPLGFREHRTHEVVLCRSPRILSGSVLDETGNHLPIRAVVAIDCSHSDLPYGSSSAFASRTDENGEFSIDGIYSATVSFYARAAGYVPYRDDHLRIPEQGAHIDVRLAPAYVVTVTVEDQDGQPVGASSVLASLSGGDVVSGGEQVEGQVGVYIVRGLPDTKLTFTAYVHSVPYNQLHDPLDPELVITVPVLGSVRATVHLVHASLVDDTWLMCLVPSSEFGAVTQYAYLHDPLISDVLPGSYYVVLRRFLHGFEYLNDFVETSQRVPVELRAGEQVPVEIWQNP